MRLSIEKNRKISKGLSGIIFGIDGNLDERLPLYDCDGFVQGVPELDNLLELQGIEHCKVLNVGDFQSI